MSHTVFVPRLARRALAALPVLIAPAISFAQPAQPAPAQPAPAQPAQPAPAPTAAEPATTAQPAPATTVATPPPAATNGTTPRPTLLPQGPLSPGMVARPASPAPTEEGRNVERTRGEFGARPSDVYAEDWWSFARPVLELHGYFRTRAELFHNFSLGRQNPASTALWPRPADDSYNQWTTTSQPSNVALCGNSDWPTIKNCTDKTQSMANMRFRLNPELHISDNLRIMSQVDLLDNLVLGSTAEGYANTPNPTAGNTGYWRTSNSGYAPIGAFAQTQVEPTANQNSFRNSIAVKRVWGEYVTPIGQLRFGRMPNHWGLGMVYNSGDGYDADYQSTVDRIMFTTAIRPLDLYVGGMWDFPYEGATSATLNQQQGQPYDLAQNDDVSQYGLMVARRRNPTLQRLDLAQGDLVINGGMYLNYRNQFLDNDAGSTGVGSTLGQNLGTDSDTLKQGYVRRNFKSWTPDLWGQVLYKKFRFEIEAAMTAGSMDTIPGGAYRNPSDTSNNGYKLRQYAVATQTELKAVEDRLRINFGWGWASGDPDLETLTPRNGFQSHLDSSKRTYSQFAMNPSHRIDLILFRHILNRVQGAYYFRPAVDYDFSRSPNGQRFGGGAAVIWSRASEFVQTPGHRRDLGVEIDLTLFYQSKDGLVNDDPDKMGGFYTMLQYGVLFPLWGLDYMPGEKSDASANQSVKLDTGAAQTLRWYMGIMF